MNQRVGAAINIPGGTIRKPAVAVFTLDDYVAAGIMLAGQAAVLRAAVADRKNILVADGTSTGKTTLANALLAEIAGTAGRVMLIEDNQFCCCRRSVPHSDGQWAPPALI